MPSLTQPKQPSTQNGVQSKHRHTNQKDGAVSHSNTNSRTNNNNINNNNNNDINEKQYPPSTKTSEHVMDNYLRDNGLFRKPVAKDGSCLFRVVAEQVYNTQARHLDVRHKCIQFMRTHRSLFEPFVEGSFEHHLFELKKSNTWAGQVEISALSHMCHRDFIVYQSSSHPQNVTGNGFPEKIFLCYSNGNHYDAVYPLKYQSNAAMVQSLLYDVLLSSVLPKVPVEEAPAGSTEQANEWTEVKPKQKAHAGRSASDDLINNALPDALQNKEVFWQMKRSLDPSFYRNIEIEVWKNSQADQQKQDRGVAILLQLKVGDKCNAYLRAANQDGGLVTREPQAVIIERISEDRKLYLVSTSGSNEKFEVALEDLRAESTDMSYKQLPGYYKKNNNRMSENGQPDRNSETNRKKGKSPRQQRQRSDGNKPRQPQSLEGEAEAQRKVDGQYNDFNGEGEERKKIKKGASSKSSAESKLHASEVADDMKLDVEVCAEEAAPALVLNEVTEPGETFVTSAEEPVSEEPVKKAKTAESPATFWGRMRGGVSPATTPRSSKPTTPTMPGGEKPTPPTTPVSNKQTTSAMSDNRKPMNTESSDSSKSTMSSSPTPHQQKTDMNDTKKVDRKQALVITEESAKAKEQISSNLDANISSKAIVDQQSRTMPPPTEEKNAVYEERMNGITSKVKIEPHQTETTSIDAKTRLPAHGIEFMSIEHVDISTEPPMIDSYSVEDNTDHDTCNIALVPDEEAVPDDFVADVESHDYDDVQIALAEEWWDEEEQCNEDETAAAVLDFGGDEASGNAAFGYESEGEMTAEQISILSSPPRELQAHLSDNANIRLTQMREKIITGSYNVDAGAKKNVIADDLPESNKVIHSPNFPNDNDSIITNLKDTAIDSRSYVYNTKEPAFDSYDVHDSVASPEQLASIDTECDLPCESVSSTPLAQDVCLDGDQAQRKNSIRKSVSFGSTTDIQSGHATNGSNQSSPAADANAENVVIKPEPGKLILPSELIEKCQVSAEANSAMLPNPDAVVASQPQQVYSSPLCMPPQQMYPMTSPLLPPTGGYPPTFVSEQCNLNHPLSKDTDGLDLPLDDTPTLRHFFNLGVIFHNNYLQYQYQYSHQQQQLQLQQPMMMQYPSSAAAAAQQMMYQPYQPMVIPPPQPYTQQQPSSMYMSAVAPESSPPGMHPHPTVDVEGADERPPMPHHVTNSPKSGYENRHRNQQHNAHGYSTQYPNYPDTRGAPRHVSGNQHVGMGHSHSGGGYTSGQGHYRDEAGRQASTRYHPPSNSQQFRYR